VVATEHNSSDGVIRFVIRPNRAMPWRDLLRFYLGMVFVSFSIAIGFAWYGAWMVLPFAGLEMLVLGVALYVVARRSTRYQVITIYNDRLEFADCGSRGVKSQTLKRAWIQVVLEPAAINGHMSRLVLRSHGKETEVAEYLTEIERTNLAHDLRHAVSQTG